MRKYFSANSKYNSLPVPKTLTIWRGNSWKHKNDKYDNPTVESLQLICDALRITFEDFVNYKDFSLSQLKAMKVIRTLSDEQLEGFCKLVNPEQE